MRSQAVTVAVVLALMAFVTAFVLVDTGPAPPTGPYLTLRVCVDDAGGRADYLDGGEDAGDALDASDFGLTGNVLSAHLSETIPENNHRYFFGSQVTGGEAQLSVSDAGAGDTQGLDSGQVYPVRVTATSDNGTASDTSDDAAASIELGVWLDTSTLSPGDDGGCS